MNETTDGADALMRAFLPIRRLYSGKWFARGWSFSETSALFHISISRGGTCTSTLAKLLHVSPPTVTQIIAKFAELGLVTRTTDSADRRMVRVKLTPSGAAVVHEIHEDTVTRFRGLASELGENDTRTLVDLLSRVSGYFSDKKEETQCLK